MIFLNISGKLLTQKKLRSGTPSELRQPFLLAGNSSHSSHSSLIEVRLHCLDWKTLKSEMLSVRDRPCLDQTCSRLICLMIAVMLHLNTGSVLSPHIRNNKIKPFRVNNLNVYIFTTMSAQGLHRYPKAPDAPPETTIGICSLKGDNYLSSEIHFDLLS